MSGTYKHNPNLHIPYICKNKQPILSPAGSESSSASRLSTPTISVDGQAQRPRNAAAAQHSTAPLGSTVDATPQVDWSDKPLLACGPAAAAAAADSNLGSGSSFGAGEWHQAGSSASKQGQPALDAEQPDRFEHSDTANLTAVAWPHLGTDQEWMQASTLHATPPLAQDMGYCSVTPSAQMSTEFRPSRTSVAGTSLTSKASTSSSSSQDDSTVLPSASMSSSSFYTHADSTVSKACSSPHHNRASAGLHQHRSCLQTPQRGVGAATSKGRGVHPASEQQGDPTSQTALSACQVCVVRHSLWILCTHSR